MLSKLKFFNAYQQIYQICVLNGPETQNVSQNDKKCFFCDF